MTNDDLHDLAAPYALDALSADERQAFETHLRECERCRAELAALRETVVALAYASEASAPPVELRDRVLVAARGELPKVIALRPGRRRVYAGAALAAAACAALAIGLWAGLSGSGGPSRPKLALAIRSSGSAQLAASGFRPAPPGKVYEIWVIHGGPPRPAGTFSRNSTVRLTRAVPRGSVVAVTLERKPGATKPTPPILAQTRATV